jgi:invasion protein IalB
MLRTTRLIHLAAIAALTASAVAIAEEGASQPNPPADSSHSGNRQQWQACRKQADDQKLPRGDARREFMHNCIKSAQTAPHQAASL